MRSSWSSQMKMDGCDLLSQDIEGIQDGLGCLMMLTDLIGGRISIKEERRGRWREEEEEERKEFYKKNTIYFIIIKIINLLNINTIVYLQKIS